MKMLRVVVLGLLVLAIAVPLAGAQVGTWDSSISIINLGGASATVEVTFFDASGASPTITCLRGTPGPSCQLTNPFSLAAGAKEEIYLPAVSQLPNGRYSAVVSADQPIAAIGAMTGVDVNKYFTGGYTGEGAGATSMYLPGIQWNFYAWDSHLSIQNLTGSPQDITVQFYTEGTNTVCNTQGPHSTPAYSSWHLDTGALSLSACDTGTDGFNGSAKVTGSLGPIAVIDNQTTDPADAMCPGCHYEVAYSGFASGATTLYAPDLSHRTWPIGHTGWNSSINVQNIGASSTVVTVTFKTTPEVIVTNDLSPNEGWLVYLPTVPGLPTSPWANFAAVITAKQPIVGIVNAANPIQQAMTYNAITAGGTKIAVPICWRNYYGWDSSFLVQNMGPDAVVLHIVYSANSNPYGTPWAGAAYDTVSIDPGKSLLVYQGNGDIALQAATGQLIPTTYLGGAIVTINSGTGPIAAVINGTNNPGQLYHNPGWGDWSISFNAVSQ